MPLPEFNFSINFGIEESMIYGKIDNGFIVN